MTENDIELILVPSRDDAHPFSKEYQVELRRFVSQANASMQRALAMDSVVGSSGPVGESIFNHAGTLIHDAFDCGCCVVDFPFWT